MRILVLLIASTVANGACVHIERDRITAGDLATAVADFAGLPPELVFGFAPQPGVIRNIEPAELRRFAAVHGISLNAEVAVCVEYPVRNLTEAEVLAAVRTGFGQPDADIELVDFSRTGVPNGDIVFERNSLAAPALATTSPLLWRGYIRYGAQRRAVIWAKVRITVSKPELVAAAAIAPGHSITKTDVRISTDKHGWTGRPIIASADTVIGQVAIRAIPAGTRLQQEWFAAPALVRPGDPVDVTVRNGGAALQFMANATTTGQLGQSVVLVNPINGKTFKATVEGLRTARLDVSRSAR